MKREAPTTYNHEKNKQKNKQREKERNKEKALLAARQGTTPGALDDTKKLVPILHLTSKIAY
jgi:hypothetical protein